MAQHSHEVTEYDGSGNAAYYRDVSLHPTIDHDTEKKLARRRDAALQNIDRFVTIARENTASLLSSPEIQTFLWKTATSLQTLQEKQDIGTRYNADVKPLFALAKPFTNPLALFNELLRISTGSYHTTLLARHITSDDEKNVEVNRLLLSIVKNFLQQINTLLHLPQFAEKTMPIDCDYNNIREEYHKTINAFVQANLRLVVMLIIRDKCSRITSSSVRDLIQAGNLGLMRAAMDFDPEKNKRFSTHATFYICARVGKFASDDRPIRLPNYMRQRERDLQSAQRKIASVDKPSLSEEDLLCEAMSVNKGELNSILGALLLTSSSRDNAHQHSSPTVDHLSNMIKNEEIYLLEKALKILSSENKQMFTVVTLRMLGEKEESLKTVGDVMHKSHEWVRYTEAKAMERLKEIIQELSGDIDNDE